MERWKVTQFFLLGEEGKKKEIIDIEFWKLRFHLLFEI